MFFMQTDFMVSGDPMDFCHRRVTGTMKSTAWSVAPCLTVGFMKILTNWRRRRWERRSWTGSERQCFVSLETSRPIFIRLKWRSHLTGGVLVLLTEPIQGDQFSVCLFTADQVRQKTQQGLEGWGTSWWRPRKIRCGSRWRSGFWFHRACWVLNNWVPSLLVNWFLYQKIWITLTKWIHSTFTFGWTWTRNRLWTQIRSSPDPVHIEQIPKALWLRKGQVRKD